MGSAKDNFKKGAVEMLLLTMLCEEDMYGYQMAQLVKKRSKGEITIPEGSMYPTLYRLMSKGYITDHQSTSGRRQLRVYYHIEPAGREHLEQIRKDYFDVNRGIQMVMDKIAEVIRCLLEDQ